MKTHGPLTAEMTKGIAAVKAKLAEMTLTGEHYEPLAGTYYMHFERPADKSRITVGVGETGNLTGSRD